MSALLLPGWDSLDTVSAIARRCQLWAIIFFALGLLFEVVALVIKEETLHDRLQRIGLVAFILCAIGEFVSYEYDGRREEMSEQQHQHELNAQKIQNDELKNQLKASKEAEEKSAKDAREAKEQSAVSAKDSAEAKRQTAEIKAANAPRRLTESQQTAFRRLTKGHPVGTLLISTNISAPDAGDYAADIGVILREAGWTVNVTTFEYVRTAIGPSPRGLLVLIKSRKPPVPTQILVNALQQAGIKFEGQVNDKMTDEVQLWVYPK